MMEATPERLSRVRDALLSAVQGHPTIAAVSLDRVVIHGLVYGINGAAYQVLEHLEGDDTVDIAQAVARFFNDAMGVRRVIDCFRWKPLAEAKKSLVPMLRSEARLVGADPREKDGTHRAFPNSLWITVAHDVGCAFVTPSVRHLQMWAKDDKPAPDDEPLLDRLITMSRASLDIIRADAISKVSFDKMKTLRAYLVTDPGGYLPEYALFSGMFRRRVRSLLGSGTYTVFVPNRCVALVCGHTCTGARMAKVREIVDDSFDSGQVPMSKAAFIVSPDGVSGDPLGYEEPGW